MLKFEYNAYEKVLTCFFTGWLDTNASIILSNEMEEKIRTMKSRDNLPKLPDEKIIFDLKEVSYISSSFIRICVSTAKQVQTGNFSIINCDPMIKKTFKIVGLDKLLNIT
jgi:anti-anti-sigma factor